jgi:hypothetical protein
MRSNFEVKPRAVAHLALAQGHSCGGAHQNNWSTTKTVAGEDDEGEGNINRELRPRKPIFYVYTRFTNPIVISKTTSNQKHTRLGKCPKNQ